MKRKKWLWIAIVGVIVLVVAMYSLGVFEFTMGGDLRFYVFDAVTELPIQGAAVFVQVSLLPFPNEDWNLYGSWTTDADGYTPWKPAESSERIYKFKVDASGYITKEEYLPNGTVATFGISLYPEALKCTVDADCTDTCIGSCVGGMCVYGQIPDLPCGNAIWQDYPICEWDDSNCIVPECLEGQTKDYICPDSSEVPWCVCVENNWSCANSPETLCLDGEPPEPECETASDCEGKTHIDCVGEWKCINENCVWDCYVPVPKCEDHGYYGVLPPYDTSRYTHKVVTVDGMICYNLVPVDGGEIPVWVYVVITVAVAVPITIFISKVYKKI